VARSDRWATVRQAIAGSSGCVLVGGRTYLLVPLRPRALFRSVRIRRDAANGLAGAGGSGRWTSGPTVPSRPRSVRPNYRLEDSVTCRVPGATSRIRAVTFSPKASTVLPAVKSRTPDARSAERCCRPVRRAASSSPAILPAARHEGHRPSRRALISPLPHADALRKRSSRRRNPWGLSFPLSVRPLRVVRPVRLVHLRA
jgi:hypothetical protein